MSRRHALARKLPLQLYAQVYHTYGGNARESDDERPPNGLRFSCRRGAWHQKALKSPRSRAPKAVNCKRVLGRGLMDTDLRIAMRCFMSGSRQRWRNARDSETVVLVLLGPSVFVEEALPCRDAPRIAHLPLR
jgi:hypothetical protein